MELGFQWKVNSEVFDATLEVSIDKGKNWMSFPLSPTEEQLTDVINKLSIISNVKKAKNIYYFFQGKDTSGNLIKDDNNGKYYSGFS